MSSVSPIADLGRQLQLESLERVDAKLPEDDKKQRGVLMMGTSEPGQERL